MGEVCSLIVDCVNKTAPLVEGPTPYRMIRVTNIKDGRLDFSECRYVDEATFRIWTRRSVPRSGDVLLTREAPLGLVAIIRDEVGVFLGQRVMQFRANPDLLDSRFLYYSFLAGDLQAQVHAHSGAGSTVDHIKVPDCSKFLISLPSLPEQKRVVEPLGYIDRRIDVLRSANLNLEAIARAVFKSWFVDFDPVRAKAEGREPEGMDAATAALFPSEFEELNGCSIPEHWMSLPLDSIAGFLNGLALQKYPASPGEDSIPAIKIAQLKRGSAESADRISPTLPAQYLVRDGDLIFSWSGSLEVEIWCGGEGALNQHLFKVTSEAYPQWFIYGWLQEHLDHFREIAASKVTTMGHIQRHHLREALVVAPPSSILEKLGATMSPLHDRIVQSRLQARTLADLRDTLLPRLISGKLRVPEAEKMVEAVL
jgi:type I restriction enzyme S subunit